LTGSPSRTVHDSWTKVGDGRGSAGCAVPMTGAAAMVSVTEMARVATPISVLVVTGSERGFLPVLAAEPMATTVSRLEEETSGVPLPLA